MKSLPTKCNDMASLRTEIDRLDRELVGLLAERARYIERAAEIKVEIGLKPRITERIDEVIENVRENAKAAGLDDMLAVSLWQQLIEWSIAREDKIMKKGDYNGR